MKKIATAIMRLLFICLLMSFQAKPLTEYCNGRFDFCISYPADFKGQGEPENGDGQVFLSKDKQAEVRAYGGLVLEDVNENLSVVYGWATKDLNVSYKVVKADWFVISGLNKEGKIVYQKTVKKKIRYMGEEQAGTFAYQTLMITYPKSQQSVYGTYCAVISKSFQ